MWVKLDDRFGDDPRVVTAGPTAAGILVFCLAYANRNLTDGWIPEAVAQRYSRQDESVLARMVTVGMLRPEVRDELPGYQIHDDYVRLQLTRAQVQDRRWQRANSGRRGGRESGRQRRARSKPEAKLKQTRSKPEAKTNPGSRVPGTGNRESRSPDSPNPESRTRVRASRARELQPGFEAFWEAYPRKENRAEAWGAWQKLAPDATLLATIIASLEWQRQQDRWLHERGRFVPMPKNWLEKRRWTDEPSRTPQISDRTLGHLRAVQEFVEESS